MAEKCATCKFWANDNFRKHDAVWSRCRVNGPETSSRCIDGRFDVWVGSWPWTRSEDWCGDYKAHSGATNVVVGNITIES